MTPNIVSQPIMQEFRALPGLYSGVFRMKIEDLPNKTSKNPNPKPAYHCPFVDNQKDTLYNVTVQHLGASNI